MHFALYHFNFQTDEGSDTKLIERQMEVLRGQVFNLREALKSHKSPVQLVQMPPQLMIEVDNDTIFLIKSV